MAVTMFFVLGAAAVTFGISFLGFFSLRRLFMPLAMIEVLLEWVRIRPTVHSTPPAPDSHGRNRPLGQRSPTSDLRARPHGRQSLPSVVYWRPVQRSDDMTLTELSKGNIPGPKASDDHSRLHGVAAADASDPTTAEPCSSPALPVTNAP